jgi:hypothetical protein
MNTASFFSILSNKYGVVPNRVSAGELASDFCGFFKEL